MAQVWCSVALCKNPRIWSLRSQNPSTSVLPRMGGMHGELWVNLSNEIGQNIPAVTAHLSLFVSYLICRSRLVYCLVSSLPLSRLDSSCLISSVRIRRQGHGNAETRVTSKRAAAAMTMSLRNRSRSRNRHCRRGILHRSSTRGLARFSKARYGMVWYRCL